MKVPSLVLAGLFLVVAGCAFAEEGINGITAISSKVSSDYVRKKRSDGTFIPEHYAFGPGGLYGGNSRDDSIDGLKFLDVARVLAKPLAGQAYLPARDPSKTNLLIMVYWGLTNAQASLSSSSAFVDLSAAENAESSAAAASLAKSGNLPTTTFVGYHGLNSGNSNSTFGVSDDQVDAISSALSRIHIANVMRDRSDFFTASMIGYDSDAAIGTERGNYVRGTAFGIGREDLLSEIEDSRYFVVLMAYDFPLLWKAKKHKLLWEARFSITARRNQFDKALPIMAAYASRYFGAPSEGLIRDRVPVGNVEVGKPILVELLPDKKK
jgi:hypothetical protein